MASISGTFLRFIDPMLAKLGYPNPKKPEFAGAVQVGWLVWNAVIKTDLDGDTSHLDSLRASIKPPFSHVTETLIERKRKEFGADVFFLGNYEVRKKADGSFSLYVEARESSAVRVH